jgi:hypothetical protein
MRDEAYLENVDARKAHELLWPVASGFAGASPLPDVCKKAGPEVIPIKHGIVPVRLSSFVGELRGPRKGGNGNDTS